MPARADKHGIDHTDMVLRNIWCCGTRRRHCDAPCAHRAHATALHPTEQVSQNDKKRAPRSKRMLKAKTSAKAPRQRNRRWYGDVGMRTGQDGRDTHRDVLAPCKSDRVSASRLVAPNFRFAKEELFRNISFFDIF
jgi:hypothetical protein